jgi:hypothetical protein
MNMNAPVASEQQMTSLTRTMRVGESVSFDNGRVVLTLEAKSGQQARIHLKLDETLKVDKPSKGSPR